MGEANKTSSPLLFNIYIEELIRKAPEDTSYEVHVSGNEIGYYVFDVVIVAISQICRRPTVSYIKYQCRIAENENRYEKKQRL